MPFANLMGLLASGTDSTAVLRCIQQVALLVQGNWVVKRWEQSYELCGFHVQGFRCESSLLLLLLFPHSDVLYPKNTCSPHSGVPAEVLCRGRDFVVRCSCKTCCVFTFLVIEPSWSSSGFLWVFFLWPSWSCLQMWRFTQERSVMRKEVASIIKVRIANDRNSSCVSIAVFKIKALVGKSGVVNGSCFYWIVWKAYDEILVEFCSMWFHKNHVCDYL